MDDVDEFEIDPAIAAAMGFSAFGAQHGQKRKFTANDTFVDPAVHKNKNVKATQANATVLGVRPAASTKSDTIASTDNPSSGSAAQAVVSRDDLEAYKRGVVNTNGDVAYFMPSFIEDPWKGLEPK